MIYSEQQLEVIECLKKDLNISINAVAGSGKTSSSLLIAESFPDKKVLLLTFNRFLADESEKRAKLSNLNNIEVKTFHAFFGKAFKRACPNDKPLLEIIESNATTDLGSEYDIIILDEIQDLNITLYQLLVRVFKRLKNGALICVFGDVRQAVYTFSGGSAIFLKEASELFNFNGKNWKNINFSTSYRISNQMSEFINDVILKDNYINANKDLPNSIKYSVVSNIFEPLKYVDVLAEDLKKYNDEDIFVIAPSVKVKNTAPIARFENYLSTDLKRPIYKPLSDEEQLTDENIKNKIVFSSIHQAKVRERKLVILFIMNNDYFKYYAKNLDPWKLPNTVYVALTRATERLIIFNNQHRTKDDGSIDGAPFLFLDLKALKKFYDKNTDVSYSEYINFENRIVKKTHEIKNHSLVTEIVRFMPRKLFNDLIDTNKIEISEIEGTWNFKKIKNHISQNYNGRIIKEPLQIYNGISIPFIFYLKRNSELVADFVKAAHGRVEDEYNDKNKKGFYELQKSNFKKITDGEMTLEKINRLSVFLACEETLNISRKNQLHDYDWIDESFVDETVEFFDSFLSNNIEFEKEIGWSGIIDNNGYVPLREAPKKYLNSDKMSRSFDKMPIEDDEYEVFLLQGRVDCIDHQNKIIYEFKFTNEISFTHILQTILYKYLLIMSDEKYIDYKMKIVNIREANFIEFDFSEEEIYKIVKIIINNFVKNDLNEIEHDKEILREAIKIFELEMGAE
jgi:hypothetical protein